MTLVPLTLCCQMLGVDAKTLRLWLSSAQLSCSPHPTDARLKCLTMAHIEHLALLHHRPFPSPPPSPAAQETALPGPGWQEQLAAVQQQVRTLQAQVADLAVALLAARSPDPLPPPTPSSTPAVSTTLPSPPRQAPPASLAVSSSPLRVRSRAKPLIQVRPDGSAVIIDPDEGLLPLPPDSSEWFSWLASLPTFAFDGPEGSFSATRKYRSGQRLQSWYARCCWHGRSYCLYLGNTSVLTVSLLREKSATMRERLIPG